MLWNVSAYYSAFFNAEENILRLSPVNSLAQFFSGVSTLHWTGILKIFQCVGPDIGHEIIHGIVALFILQIIAFILFNTSSADWDILSIPPAFLPSFYYGLSRHQPDRRHTWTRSSCISADIRSLPVVALWKTGQFLFIFLHQVFRFQSFRFPCMALLILSFL